MESISVPSPAPDEAGAIPASAALVQAPEDPETQQYLISFKHYDDGECEIDAGGHMKHYAYEALKTIKDMGYRGITPNSRHVHDNNEYTKLFNHGIRDIPDIEMREVYLEAKYKDGAGKKVNLTEGRMFFFTIKRTLYMVAIRSSHYETKKR